MTLAKVIAGIGISVASLIGASIIDKGLHKIVDPKFDEALTPVPDGDAESEETALREVQDDSDLEIEEMGEVVSG